MKEIKFRFEDGRLIFQVADEEYFLPAEGFLSLLDRQKNHDIFEGLKPERRFANLNRLESCVMHELLTSRGVPREKIAEKLKIVSVEVMDEWLKSGFLKRTKEERKDDFQAMLRGLSERSTKSLLDDRIT